VEELKFDVGTKLRILVDRPYGAHLSRGEIVEVTKFEDVIHVNNRWTLLVEGHGKHFIHEPVLPSTPSGDAINHPSHYNQGKIEVIEFIEDKNLGFHLGNAVKYISRAGKKDPAKEIEDLKKAVWYVERQIELISGGTRRPNEMVQK
jgi:hypothetical protein